MSEAVKLQNEKNIKVLMVPRYELVEQLKEQGIEPDATVEAEYGNTVVRGKKVTLAHHVEEFRNNPAPCNTEVEVLPENSVIMVSHFDLDTLGGCLALMGKKPDDRKFWEAVEFIDKNGPHHLKKLGEREQHLLNAFWAWNYKSGPQRAEGIIDITDKILEAGKVVEEICKHNPEMIKEGMRWAEEAQAKVEKNLVLENELVRVFITGKEGVPKSSVFCSAAYYSPKLSPQMNEEPIPATVVLNKEFGAITVAFADGGKNVSAKEIVQELWGNKAGGHPGIAGSPRGQKMTEKDLVNAVRAVLEKQKFPEVDKFINKLEDKVISREEPELER